MKMKTLFLLPILLLSLLSTSCWGWGEETVDWSDLLEREGIYYKKFSDTPFTGKVSGQEQGKMKNGNKEGEWTRYYDNGQLKRKGSYKNGIADGEYVFYGKNGQISAKGSFKNGRSYDSVFY